MKHIIKLILLSPIGFAAPAFAQDARTLIKEGVGLSNTGNHAAAIEKYKAALAAEPDNTSANYQMAFALNASGKGKEAIPFLRKVTAHSQASPQILSSAYSLMGGIYDKGGQAKLAIENYQQAIKIDSADAGLHYSLGLAYFRARQYANAEKSAVASLTINPNHAGSMRLYGLVTFHQNKRAPALLALCTFLWMEPNEGHAGEAFGNLQSILKGGTLKPEPGIPPLDANNKALNLAITQAVTEVAKRRYVMATDQLTEQLTAVFNIVGKLAVKQSGDKFFGQMATRYLKLSQSGHVPAFARYIRQNTDKAAAEWLRANARQLTAMQAWMKEN